MRVLITGASGHLGGALLETAPPGADVVAAGHQHRGAGMVDVDIADPASVESVIAGTRPDVVLHVAALTAVGEAERHPERAAAVNASGAGLVAGAARRHGCRLVAMSTDVVFGGDRPPYREQDPPAPPNVYGRTKARGEQAVLAAHPGALILRTSVMVGRSRGEHPSFSDFIVGRARSGGPLPIFDEIRSFIPVTTVATVLWELAGSSLTGVLHVAGREGMARLTFARALLEATGLDPSVAVPAPRPAGGPPRAGDLTLDVGRAGAHLETILPSPETVVSTCAAEYGST